MQLATVAEFQSREEADRARRILTSAEITSTVQQSAVGFQLCVADESVYEARQYLGMTENQTKSTATTTGQVGCPECGSFETRKLAPYSLVLFVVSLAATIALFAFRQVAIGFSCS